MSSPSSGRSSSPSSIASSTPAAIAPPTSGRRIIRSKDVRSLQLHHLYRAMAWLGEELPRTEQADKTPFAPRCTKDLIEERLFAHRRDLFTELQLVFFDTTSIYFEGEGGETIGQRGHSKDHRPDLKQMIVGVVLDGQGRPICCELWPGNTADVTTLIPVVDRLRKRFGVGKVCIVADRGMISKETIEELEKPERGWQYILGARMRAQNEVKDEVLARAGRYRVVHPKRDRERCPLTAGGQGGLGGGPSLHRLSQPGRGPQGCRGSGGHRGVAAREAPGRGEVAGRQQGLSPLPVLDWSGSLPDRRGQDRGGGSLRRQVGAPHQHGPGCTPRWRCSTSGSGWWRRTIRSCKSLLQTRPIYHKCDETIRGHVFCSFLAMVLRQELEARLARRGDELEWADVIADLDRLQMAEVGQDGKRFLLRSEVQGTCGLVFQAAGVAVPPTVQRVAPPPDSQESDPSATPPL